MPGRTRATGKEDSNREVMRRPGNMPALRTREDPLVGGLRFLVALFDFNAGGREVRAARARVRRSAASPDEMGASPYSTPSRCLRS